MVRDNTSYPLQESYEQGDYLSGEIRDGRATGRSTAQGQRDYVLLLFLYNTSARADEEAQLTIAALQLAHAPARDFSSVQIRGKGNKLRRCPLWPHTVSAITTLITDRGPHEHVFLNRWRPAHHPVRYSHNGRTLCPEIISKDASTGHKMSESPFG